MNYYALSWEEFEKRGCYGYRLAYYHVFDSRNERDKWVDEGAKLTTQPDFREALSSRDPELRMFMNSRDLGDDLYWHYKDEAIKE